MRDSEFLRMLQKRQKERNGFMGGKSVYLTLRFFTSFRELRKKTIAEIRRLVSR